MISSSRVKLIDGVSVAESGTSTSVWYPCGGMLKKTLKVVAPTQASPDYQVDIRFSPHHYYVLRGKDTDGTNSTDFYNEYTLAANHTSTAEVEYSSDDQAEMDLPWASVQVKVTGNAGTSTNLVTAILEGYISNS